MSAFTLQQGALDEARLSRELAHAGAGAQVAFAGRVRNLHDGQAVIRLDYEAVEGLCLKEGALILQEARRRFGLLGVRAVHGLGSMVPGDCAVWVGVLAVHRQEAFSACQWVIDQIKLRLPIWKCEFAPDGSHRWVNCAACAHPADGASPSTSQKADATEAKAPPHV